MKICLLDSLIIRLHEDLSIYLFICIFDACSLRVATAKESLLF